MTRGYGFTPEAIDWCCPAELEPYAKAHKLEQKEQDTFAWLYGGNYILSAVAVALEHCLAGNKARSEYIKEPILTQYGEYDGLSQEEIEHRELQKMLSAEKQWQMAGKQGRLVETIVK